MPAPFLNFTYEDELNLRGLGSQCFEIANFALLCRWACRGRPAKPTGSPHAQATFMHAPDFIRGWKVAHCQSRPLPSFVIMNTNTMKDVAKDENAKDDNIGQLPVSFSLQRSCGLRVPEADDFSLLKLQVAGVSADEAICYTRIWVKDCAFHRQVWGSIYATSSVAGDCDAQLCNSSPSAAYLSPQQRVSLLFTPFFKPPIYC